MLADCKTSLILKNELLQVYIINGSYVRFNDMIGHILLFSEQVIPQVSFKMQLVI